jgi:hypothetical protein
MGEYRAILTCGIIFKWEEWKEFIPFTIYFDGRILFEEEPKLSSIINCNIVSSDVLKLVLGFLPWNTFLACRRVCKQWYQLLKSSASWPQSQIDNAHKIIKKIDQEDLVLEVMNWVDEFYLDYLYLRRTYPCSNRMVLSLEIPKPD